MASRLSLARTIPVNPPLFDLFMNCDRVVFVADCKSIGIEVHVSERKATENYFEHNGIQKALGAEYKPLEPYQRLKFGTKPWHKCANWRIARETEFKDIENTDLGKFLSSL